MQIVRELAGYTMGRSDLVRRAMSKKKASVMEKERQNFIYGNAEENVPGCINNGISESVASKIYDDMTDFAKYAFNKSHAACYAVVSYQTAYLKCYYPKEFFAALLTSVLGNTGKVAEYIFTCRKMGIEVISPDVNEGFGPFTVSGDKIRYGMLAIKSLGLPVIEAVIREREANGKYKDMQDFVERLSGKEVNKRTMENFIKSGAFDCFGANRQQLMLTYTLVMEEVSNERKGGVAGQMSLFDYEGVSHTLVPLPKVPEFSKEELLSYEKEVLGIYVSGHPLDDYEELWRKNVTNTTQDFINEEEAPAKVKETQKVIVGGMITAKTLKTTKTGNTMAFLNIEDMFGTVEVLVFPKIYDNYKLLLTDDNKVFVRGRVNFDEEENGKIIADSFVSFSEVPKDIWIQFADMNEYLSRYGELEEAIKSSDGKDFVVIYLKAEKQKKVLARNLTVNADKNTFDKFCQLFGEANVKVVQKTIEK